MIDLNWLKCEEETASERRNYEDTHGDVSTAMYFRGREQAFGQVIDRLEGNGQPELPEIPDYVAEWIKTIREINGDIIGSLIFGNYNVEVGEWLFLDVDTINVFNAEELMSAWVHGYSVEEKKYRVKDGNITLLAKINDSILTTVEIVEYYPEHTPVFELTEQEVKDFDERYFAFAVPVGEEE